MTEQTSSSTPPVQSAARVQQSAAARLKVVGQDAVAAKGWWQSYRWLILRRTCQIVILLLFIVSPWLAKSVLVGLDFDAVSPGLTQKAANGLWVMEGNLTSSKVLEVIPLSDPFVLLQTLFTGHWPYREALIGAAIVLAFYLLIGGRVFCSWVCPVNIVTDAASWLRRRLGIKGGKAPSPKTRYWLLVFVMIAALMTGSLAWEWINPVSLLHRSLIFGFGLSWGIIIGIFFYDLLFAQRGWCGHLCPQGAFYSLLGRTALVRVSAYKRSVCNDCMDCFAVCPEPHVIRPALKGVGQTHPVILDADCTTCGRCIDVCSERVFHISTRFDRSES